MRHQCSGCGIEATPGQVLTREAIPFCKDRFYCSRCHERFFARVHLFLIAIYIAGGVIGLGVLVFNRSSQVGQALAGLLVLCVVEALAVIVHEFGHAFGGRAVGFEVSQVIIGIGHRLGRLRVFGFETEFRLAPFMGVCFGRPRNGQAAAWRHFVFIFSGPLANLVVAGLTYLFFVQGGLFEIEFMHVSNAAGMAVLVNLGVGAANLIPFQIPTPYGKLASDGLGLARIILPRRMRDYGAVSGARKALAQCVKWGTVVGLSFCCALCVFLAALLAVTGAAFGPIGRVLFAMFFLGLAAPLAWIAWRRARDD